MDNNQNTPNNPYENQSEDKQYVYTEPWMGGVKTTSQQSTQNNPYGQTYRGGIPYQPYNPTPASSGGMVGFSIAGMILGILSVILCFFLCFDWIISIPGLIFSIIALSKNYAGKGMAIAGLVCSGVGTLLSLGYFVIIFMEM